MGIKWIFLILPTYEGNIYTSSTLLSQVFISEIPWTSLLVQSKTSVVAVLTDNTKKNQNLTYYEDVKNMLKNLSIIKNGTLHDGIELVS
jgi:hypothetical protein